MPYRHSHSAWGGKFVINEIGQVSAEGIGYGFIFEEISKVIIEGSASELLKGFAYESSKRIYQLIDR